MSESSVGWSWQDELSGVAGGVRLPSTDTVEYRGLLLAVVNILGFRKYTDRMLTGGRNGGKDEEKNLIPLPAFF
jgi:hypothetical protein